MWLPKTLNLLLNCFEKLTIQKSKGRATGVDTGNFFVLLFEVLQIWQCELSGWEVG